MLNRFENPLEHVWNLCTFDFFLVCPTGMDSAGVSLKFQSTQLSANQESLHSEYTVDYDWNTLSNIDTWPERM